MAYPIIGDTSHGDRRHNRLFREQFGIQRLLLVARRMTIVHPVSGAVQTIEAELGQQFEAALARLNLEHNFFEAE
jgi:tRNA pseudouridine65 synthase